MLIKFGKRSKVNLSSGLDYRLVHIACEVSKMDCPCDWTVFETKRTLEKQKEYVAKGVSKTLNSRHIPDSNGIVRAMDIVPYVDGKNTWEEKYFHELIKLFKEAAERLYPNQIEFGYDWTSFKDMPHIQIRKGYEI